jgi:probable addiction module antidote protein
MNETSVKYETGLKESLLDPEEAAAYLNAALEEDDQEIFLLALRDIAEARGFSRIAQESFLNRENLYRMLSATGNPQLSSLNTLLRTIGLRLAVEVESA